MRIGDFSFVIMNARTWRVTWGNVGCEVRNSGAASRRTAAASMARTARCDGRGAGGLRGKAGFRDGIFSRDVGAPLQGYAQEGVGCVADEAGVGGGDRSWGGQYRVGPGVDRG